MNVLYSGTSALTTGVELPASGTVLKNLTINNTGGLTVTLNQAEIVNGTLSLAAGYLKLSSALTMAAAATINRSAGAFSSTYTPTFNGGVNVIYSGGTGVFTGTELPATGILSLTVNDPGAVVTLNAAKTLASGGSISVTNGTLSNGTFTITPNGSNTLSVSAGAAFIASGTFPGLTTVNLAATSTVIYAGAATVAAQSYGNLTIGTAATLATGTTASVAGTITLANGALTNSGTLSLANGATINRSGTGSIGAAPKFGTSVNVIYLGLAALTTGAELPTVTTVLSNLTINDPLPVTLNAATTVNGVLSLSAGTFNLNAKVLTMASGTSINRTGGFISAAPTFTGTVNVSYLGVGSVNTGLELPTAAAALKNLTINQTGTGTPTVTLGQNLTVNGSLTLTSGTLAAATYALTLNGGFTNNAAAGAFTGTGTVSFGGTTAQTLGGSFGTTFNNLTINDSAGVTVADNTTVAGSLTLNVGHADRWFQHPYRERRLVQQLRHFRPVEHRHRDFCRQQSPDTRGFVGHFIQQPDRQRPRRRDAGRQHDGGRNVDVDLGDCSPLPTRSP